MCDEEGHRDTIPEASESSFNSLTILILGLITVALIMSIKQSTLKSLPSTSSKRSRVPRGCAAPPLEQSCRAWSLLTHQKDSGLPSPRPSLPSPRDAAGHQARQARTWPLPHHCAHTAGSWGPKIAVRELMTPAGGIPPWQGGGEELLQTQAEVSLKTYAPWLGCECRRLGSLSARPAAVGTGLWTGPGLRREEVTAWKPLGWPAVAHNRTERPEHRNSLFVYNLHTSVSTFCLFLQCSFLSVLVAMKGLPVGKVSSSVIAEEKIHLSPFPSDLPAPVAEGGRGLSV